MIELLAAFDNQPTRNAWLRTLDGQFAMYVRHSWRAFEVEGMTRLLHTLDLASIEVEESLRGLQTFTMVLEWLVVANKLNLLVESIINRRLATFLVRQGFTLRGDNCVPDAYLLQQPNVQYRSFGISPLELGFVNPVDLSSFLVGYRYPLKEPTHPQAQRYQHPYDPSVSIIKGATSTWIYQDADTERFVFSPFTTQHVYEALFQTRSLGLLRQRKLQLLSDT